MKNINKYLKLGLVFGVLSLSAIYVYAIATTWQGPGSGHTPQNWNVDPPINTSSNSQYKEGALGIGGIFHGDSDGYFDGNLGIGTTTPRFILDAEKNYDGMTYITVENRNNTANSRSGFLATNNSGNGVSIAVTSPNFTLIPGWANRGIVGADIAIEGITLAAKAATADIRFETGGKGSLFEKMRILSNGNVGIGTTNPTEKLDVNGNVKTTGVLTAGKVQIVDVVVENTDCAPMGLVARDNTGILLSCQGSPLKWKKASGGGSSSSGPFLCVRTNDPAYPGFVSGPNINMDLYNTVYYAHDMPKFDGVDITVRCGTFNWTSSITSCYFFYTLSPYVPGNHTISNFFGQTYTVSCP